MSAPLSPTETGANCGWCNCPNGAIACSWPREFGTFFALCSDHAYLLPAAHLRAVERIRRNEPSLGERLGFQPLNSRTHGYNGQEHR